MSDAKGFNVGGSPVLAKDEAARNQIAIMNAVSAVAFNNRVDRNWDGQGSIVANATDVTTDFNNGTLSTKIANMDFDDYDTGMQIKKTITVNNNSYVAHIIFAHANAFYGYSSYAMVNTPNIGCVVYLEGLTTTWNASNTDGGYTSSNLRTVVQDIVTALQSALGNTHMVSHSVLLSNATSGGKSSGWAWATGSYGEALSCPQMFGITVSGSYFDVGEAYEQLALFKNIRPNQVFGNVNIWTREVLTASYAAVLGGSGALGSGSVTGSLGPALLILLK